MRADGRIDRSANDPVFIRDADGRLRRQVTPEEYAAWQREVGLVKVWLEDEEETR